MFVWVFINISTKTNKISLSLDNILGVVPVAITAWNPEIAPHAITMKINGKTLDRMSSDNTIDELEFSVGTCVKQ